MSDQHAEVLEPFGEDDEVEVARIPLLVAKHREAAILARENGVQRHLTDSGNADRFVDHNFADFLHDHTAGIDLLFDGCRYAPDQAGLALHLARATGRAIYAEASKAEDAKDRRELADWAKASESATRLRAMLELARSDPLVAVTYRDLDGDPWLFNVANGTLDLRTGRLRDHSRADKITRLAAVAYDARAVCPTWESFLLRIMAGDVERIGFLQRYVGYSLTGDTREQCLVMAYGTGANGKSTLVATLRRLLGDFATTTPTESLLVKRGDVIPSDLARLKGARFVSAIESEGGRRLAESLVKAMTGNDAITARHLYGRWFEFEPTFKLFLATNHKPTIRGTDLAIWRRIRLLPFDVTIPPEEQDKTLADKLAGELSGILNWALAGCAAWQRDGLPTPEAVRAATEAYRSEQDIVAAFLAERCITGRGKHAFARDLYAAYTAWCESNGEEPVKQRTFGQALREKGFDSTKERALHVWLGVTLGRDEA